MSRLKRCKTLVLTNLVWFNLNFSHQANSILNLIIDINKVLSYLRNATHLSVKQFNDKYVNSTPYKKIKFTDVSDVSPSSFTPTKD